MKNKKTGIELIAQERKEQIEKHGYTPELDRKQYSNESLLQAAKYCLTLDPNDYPYGWSDAFAENIERKQIKLSTIDFDIEMRKIAGAFLAADIDLLLHEKDLSERTDTYLY